MRFWLASIVPETIRDCFALGLFEGVLTNPTMLAAAKRPPRELVPDLCAASSGPVFYQVPHGTADAMKQHAAEWLDLGLANLGIKVPLTRAGCEVLHWLGGQKVEQRLGTCAPTLVQVLLATSLDLPWVTPSGSALERIEASPKVGLLAEMQALLDRQKARTRIIPSLASPSELCALAAAGIGHGFIWDRDVDRFLQNELVTQLVDSFASASEKLKAWDHY